ncbi:YhcN/YlaJ family sporulation lipoprotein [Bacillus sp. REN16]|uniref:YhcN/YlaJ family sporulation lipoprotein n=1 Tax=Bacillus sp. REN16 TaxID=2887296 RepID=UPI001E5839D8|nr:YhcN/YlaJ family sporulation lipoprotein [Bacillus sp. REN16]MCC3356577.1 YhcN/YlaJ family sporulation lipoprotein [Bacillus sp. REN16]
MRKILYSVSTAALLLGGLTACNTDQGASTNSNDNARPIGYYSNEDDRDRNVRNGNGYQLRDNDGPLTEIMDRNGNNFNRNDRTGVMNNRNDRNNKTGIMNNRNDRNNNSYSMDNDKTRKNRPGIMNYRDEQRRTGIMNNRDGRTINPYNDGNPNTIGYNKHGYADQNYHSHLNDNNHKVQTYGYYNDNGNLVRKISERAEKVKNVEDARVIVTDDNVLIAVDTNDNNNRNNVQNAVEKAVAPLAGNRNVNVVTDEGTFTRVRDIDNNIRNGNRRETIDADIKDLFDNIGNTIKAPFTNHNRG